MLLVLLSDYHLFKILCICSSTGIEPSFGGQNGSVTLFGVTLPRVVLISEFMVV